MDYNFIALIEKLGCTDSNGHRLYGTAALLYFLHRPVSSISEYEIQLGKSFIQGNFE